jgi:hypothetical protein
VIYYLIEATAERLAAAKFNGWATSRCLGALPQVVCRQ